MWPSTAVTFSKKTPHAGVVTGRWVNSAQAPLDGTITFELAWAGEDTFFFQDTSIELSLLAYAATVDAIKYIELASHSWNSFVLPKSGSKSPHV